MALRFESTERARADDLDAVDAGLDAYNQAEPELRHVRPLSVFARDGDGPVLAGAVGRTWGRCGELQRLWVAEALRRQGIGRTLMQQFEAAAAQRGCTLVYLDTFSFQAPSFYRALGYRVALETPGFTGGIVKFTLHKALPARPATD